jgi:hypothetical protein
MGTALNQMKRNPKLGFVLHNTHNKGLEFGNDTGLLEQLPLTYKGVVVDVDYIYGHFDDVTIPVDTTYDPDVRFYLRSKAPRPCTILAAIVNTDTNEK